MKHRFIYMFLALAVAFQGIRALATDTKPFDDESIPYAEDVRDGSVDPSECADHPGCLIEVAEQYKKLYEQEKEKNKNAKQPLTAF